MLLAATSNLHAAQVVQGSPDATLSAQISRFEPTMIRVDGARVRRIFGAQGDFTVVPDNDTGAAFIKPMTDKPSFSVFVTDEEGRTWKLLLAVTGGPADTIVIKGTGSSSTPKGKDLPRNQAIKETIAALNSNDGSATDKYEPIPLWRESDFVLVRVVDTPLRGEKYLLTNKSSDKMIIDERELYKKGVLAIAIEQPELAPGESTEVYVVMEGN